MAKYAIIEDKTVVNIVVADDDYASLQGWVLLDEGVGIGWSYIKKKFVDNRPKIEVDNTNQLTKEDLLKQLEELSKQIQALS